jgi:hypothetical protein|tara:strand:- start:2725 stop:3552 length:828 start_codon:yes stop_codon:yes gene_type:complete
MDVNIDSITGTPHNYFNRLDGTNPTVIMALMFVLILYYLLFASLGESQTPTVSYENGGNTAIGFELLLWAVFIMLLLLNGMSLYFNTDIKATIKNLISPTPEIDLEVTSDDPLFVPMKPREKEVFHIPGNKYGYDDAKAVCISYGGRLATYQEISDAYDKGADWCGYGWSDGQHALFPTQKWKWENLQSIDGHEHDCGRPGINGGYIENPNVRFGVNCYGYKPDMTPDEGSHMESATLYQKTNRELDFEKRVDFWRTKIPDILLAPFNHNTWSIV